MAMLRPDSFLRGLHGLALLRRWPYGASPTDARANGLPHREGGDDTAAGSEIEQVDVGPGYQRWAATYDSLANPLLAAEEPEMARMLQRFAVGRALDAASGTGRFGAYLADRGHEVVALDSSRAMIQQARSRGVNVLMGDLRSLPIRDETIDLTVCGLALTHLADLRSPIAELARVTRPSGHVVISDIHPFALALGGHALFRDLDGRNLVVRNHQHWHSDYIRALEGAGLRIRGCVEPTVSEGVVALMSEPLRDAFRGACLGLPYVLIWDTEKRS
jgi:ubiquinone/menaquinone biosynthesis C-methylase UbiE